jgi:hypothetical protein
MGSNFIRLKRKGETLRPKVANIQVNSKILKKKCSIIIKNDLCLPST